MNDARSAPPQSGLLSRIPCKLLLTVVGISLAVEEFYPLSWFPMFTSLPRSTWYVYVKDESGPLAAWPEFRCTGDRIDNRYKNALDRVREESPELDSEASTQQATQTLLRELAAERRAIRGDAVGDGALELWRTDIKVKDGTLRANDRFVGRLSLPDAGAPESESGDARR